MNKNTYTSVKLTKGEMNVYDFGTIRLHAYKTNDLIDDEVFVVEMCIRDRIQFYILSYFFTFINMEVSVCSRSFCQSPQTHSNSSSATKIGHELR